jgi:parallel beta-helix repeat protein
MRSLKIDMNQAYSRREKIIASKDINCVKSLFMLFSILFIFIYSVFAICQAETLHLYNGPGNGSCPRGCYQDLQRIINAADNKTDQIVVHSGTYFLKNTLKIKKDNLIIRGIATGKEMPKITWESHHDDARTIRPEKHQPLNDTMIWINASGVTLDGFDIVNIDDNNFDSYGVVVTKDNCIIKNNTISKFNKNDLMFINSNNNQIVNNSMESAENGLLLEASSNNIIKGNIIGNNKVDILLDLNSSGNSIFTNSLMNAKNDYAIDPGENGSNQWDKDGLGNYYGNNIGCIRDEKNVYLCKNTYEIKPGSNIDRYPLSYDNSFSDKHLFLNISAIKSAKAGDTILINISFVKFVDPILKNITIVTIIWRKTGRVIINETNISILNSQRYYNIKIPYIISEEDLPGPLVMESIVISKFVNDTFDVNLTSLYPDIIDIATIKGFNKIGGR